MGEQTEAATRALLLRVKLVQNNLTVQDKSRRTDENGS